MWETIGRELTRGVICGCGKLVRNWRLWVPEYTFCRLEIVAKQIGATNFFFTLNLEFCLKFYGINEWECLCKTAIDFSAGLNPRSQLFSVDTLTMIRCLYSGMLKITLGLLLWPILLLLSAQMAKRVLPSGFMKLMEDMRMPHGWRTKFLHLIYNYNECIVASDKNILIFYLCI